LHHGPMNILFIATLPPPVTGQALASKVLLDAIAKRHAVETINYNRWNLGHGMDSFRRVREVIWILGRIYRGKKRADVIYITITQSIAGNVKDLMTYLLCRDKLPCTIIHLHGGALKATLFDRSLLLRFLNRYFYRRLGGVVVLGESLAFNFRGMVSQERLHVVPNFAEDYMFSTRDEVERKFRDVDPVRIAFLSNLISGKGHEELADAYLGLSDDAQRKLRIDFAGGFESEQLKERFLARIKGYGNLRYHGVLSGEAKRSLLAEAHLFCLPTYYRYEGQPIAILEAYASGCAVVTTDHAGIRDIFRDGENGYRVEMKSVSSLRSVLERAAGSPERLLSFGLRNLGDALDKYRQNNYCASLIGILEDIGDRRTEEGPP